jgi:hypothetical protein
MHKSQQTARQQKIERPVCPRCNALMWIARIEPDEPGHDRRTCGVSRDGAIIFADLIGKLDTLRVACDTEKNSGSLP